MSDFIQINTSSEGTYEVSYNCSDECGNNSNPADKERKMYIRGDGDNFVIGNSSTTAHGSIAVFPSYVEVRQGTFYNDRSFPGHIVTLYDGLFKIHAEQRGNNINTNPDRITTSIPSGITNSEGIKFVSYFGYITLPNGYRQPISGRRTVQVTREGIINPPIIRPPIEDIWDPPEFNYLDFGNNPEITNDQGVAPAPPGDGGGGGSDNSSNETCAMYSISTDVYQYNRKIIIRKNNNLHTILDEANSINLSNLYQELTKGDSNNPVNIINDNSFELNPYVEGEDYFTTGPLTADELSYSGNWDIILIVQTNSNTNIEYGFLYDISNNSWKVKNYIINSSYVESVSSYEVNGNSIEIAELTFSYISLCLDDPVITITGDNPLSHNVGNSFTDPGATAVDDLGNSLAVNAVNNVNKDVVGAYTITYSTTDTYGNTSTATRTVNVDDNIAPVITIIGDNPKTIQALTTYNDQGATAIDNYDNSVNVTSSGTVDTDTIGSYTVTYSASDSSGNTSTKTRTINVVNNTPPNLTILGNNPYDLNVFTNFVDPGATATDIFGNSVNVSSTNNINKDVLGNYSVNYSATDSYGNTQTASRVVNVVDVTNPTITILGDNPMEVDLNGTYSEPGAVGNDNYTSPINVTISGSVNTSSVGTYTITYSASDSSGNSASATRSVKVINNTPPTITLTGANPLYHEVNTVFTDPGASAQDVYGNSIQVTASGTVNVNVLGSYQITYTATDNDSNSHSVIRTVIVRDTTAPVITLVGNSTITLQLNSNYSEQGANATDNYDSSVNVSISGTINTSIPATYVITYSATDSSDNNSTKTRNVIVENNEPPIITVLGDDPVILALNASYTDAGATAVDAVGNSITVSSSSNVDTSQYGTYSVNYTATDIWGNTANGRRNVRVSDFTAPTITLIGPQTMTIILGQTFTDPGATATDPADGTVSVTSTGNVNVNIIGQYTITYRAQDGEGRETTITRTVIVTSGPGGDDDNGGILGGGIPLSSSNFSSNGCININLSLPALSGYTGANPSINRAIIIRTTDNGGTPAYIYDNGTRNEYKYPNSPLNMSGTVFELEKSDPDYGLSIINDDGDFLEPQFYISSYNSDNWSNIAPVNDDYFGGNWEIISIQGNWSSGGSVTVTAFIFDIANTRWKTKSYTKSNTSGSIYKINNWSENTFNGAGPHDIAGITVKFNMECIIPQCANVGYSAASYSFDREIFTKYEDSVISAWDETDNPSNTGSFEIMCAPYVMGGSVSVKNTQGKFLSAFPTSSTFTTGPVSPSDLSLDGNWELIITDYSNSSTNSLQHAIFYSGLYNKWYRTTYVFNNGIVSNMTTGEVSGTTITLSNITFNHNGFNDNAVITKPTALGTTHTVIWLYSTNPAPTETASIVLNTTYPVSWSLSNENSNAGVLSYTNSGNLVVTYRKDLVLNGGTSGFGGYVDYQFTYTATATILTNTFNYTINVTHRYYNPSSGGGGGGGDPPPPGDQNIIKDINDIDDPFDPLDGL